MGAINKDGMDFLSDLGRRITQITDNHRESAFLFQRLCLLIQRYNIVAVLGTLIIIIIIIIIGKGLFCSGEFWCWCNLKRCLVA